MQYRKGNHVKLAPFWPNDDTAMNPVWGGLHGYHIGAVTKTLTHDPDLSKHSVIVKWDNGPLSQYTEQYLQKADDLERAVAHDFNKDLHLDRDVWTLIRTDKGELVLNLIETNVPKAVNDPQDRKFTATLTKMALPNSTMSTADIVNQFLSFPDNHDIRTTTLLEAMQHLYALWGLPKPTAVSLPLPEVASVAAAASSAPPEGPAVMHFHLPSNLLDYSAMLSS